MIKLNFIFICLVFLGYGKQIEPNTFQIFKESYPESIKKVLLCGDVTEDSLANYSTEIMKPFIAKKYSGYEKFHRYAIRTDLENIPLFLSLIDYTLQDDPERRSSSSSWICDTSFGKKTIAERWYTYPLKFILRHTTYAWIDSNKTEIINRVQNRSWSDAKYSIWGNQVDSLAILAMVPGLDLSVNDTVSYYKGLPLWLKARVGDITALESMIVEYQEIEDADTRKRKMHELLLTQKRVAYQAIVLSANKRVYLSETEFRKRTRISFISSTIYAFEKVFSTNRDFMKIAEMHHFRSKVEDTVSGRQRIIDLYEAFIRKNILPSFSFEEEEVQIYLDNAPENYQK